MKLEILPDAASAARSAALHIAQDARAVVTARGRFSLALSGGTTPGLMFDVLVETPVPWPAVHIFQVDERVAPRGGEDRNLTQLRKRLLERLPVPPAGVHAMPVEEGNDALALARYAQALESVAGEPPLLDLVHLGLGDDGHTASLVPGDAAVEIRENDVAMTAVYRGRRRMTLTLPALNRARGIVWLVTGESKAEALLRLVRGDESIPAARVQRDLAIAFVDAAAARLLPMDSGE